MKIDYPIIKWEDVREGDVILTQWSHPNAEQTYREFTVRNTSYDLVNKPETIAVHYLIDRPMPKFPEEYGSVIIAYKVRGMPFPDGIPLARQRGGQTQYGGPYWKSFTQKVIGADQHGERQIEDWVLAKVVPA